MKVLEYSGKQDIIVLSAMVANPTVLGRVAAAWTDEGLFASPELNRIARMCVRYYRRHGTAPKKSILETLIIAWADRHPAMKDQIELTEKCVNLIESDPEVVSDHSIDMAMTLFTKVSLVRHAEAIQKEIELGNIEKAEELRSNFKKVELTPQQGGFLDDKEIWLEAFPKETNVVLELDGGLGKFFGDSFQRSTFYAFLAPEKRGKSRWLAYLAWQAVERRKKVAYFEAGDMSRQQVTKRFSAYTAKRPYGPGKIKIPVNIKANGFAPEDVTVKFREEEHKGYLDGNDGYKGYLRLLETSAKSRGKLFWLSCYPTGTLSVEMIHDQLVELEREKGWVPDCVFVDYADILARPSGKMDSRDQINLTWLKLRGVSLARYCCLITATQANRDSYDRELIRMSNCSEDKRKLGYPNGIMGINVTPTEKDQDRSRLNWVSVREKGEGGWYTVHCAGCLAIGNPAILSVYPSEKGESNGEKDRIGFA